MEFAFLLRFRPEHRGGYISIRNCRTALTQCTWTNWKGKSLRPFLLVKEWGAEQTEILSKIEQHHNANRSYLEEGTLFLELAQEAVTLYENRKMEEKRRLLNFVFSNSTWKEGKLIPPYPKPFDLLALTNTAYQSSRRGPHGPSLSHHRTCRSAYGGS
jgi:hypothetical protein